MRLLQLATGSDELIDQVIVISDDPRASSWASLAGADRVAVVCPQRV